MAAQAATTALAFLAAFSAIAAVIIHKGHCLGCHSCWRHGCTTATIYDSDAIAATVAMVIISAITALSAFAATATLTAQAVSFSQSKITQLCFEIFFVSSQITGLLQQLINIRFLYLSVYVSFSVQSSFSVHLFHF